jgi:hypothetical protein
MPPRTSSKRRAWAAGLVVATAVAALAARAQPPAPAAPAPGWSFAPFSPGRWTYSGGASPSARYGISFTIRCLAPGRIQLERSGATGGALTFRTTAMERSVRAAEGPSGVTAELPAGDPLLDALAFSRGRFAVEAAGLPRLIVPAWPELARVVEDCRR